MIACAVLAAGGSRRLGTPKQLVMLDGVPLVARAVATCAAHGRVAVVVGASAEAVGAVVSVELIQNDDWREGIASSIRAATRWARATAAEALLLHLVDQPLIDSAHLAALVSAYRGGAPLAGTRFDEVVGAPAIFDARYYDELLGLEGDRGAAGILRASMATGSIPFTGAAVDVDTPEDVQRLLASSPNATRR